MNAGRIRNHLSRGGPGRNRGDRALTVYGLGGGRERQAGGPDSFRGLATPVPMRYLGGMLTEHEIEIRVRYSETDAMGYLHHANYFAYFEMGRTELLRASGGNYRQMEEQGEFMVVVSLECKYRKPARYDDVLTLRTRVARVTPAKIEHTYSVLRGDELLTEARSVLACVDRNGAVQRIPESLRAGL